MGQVVDTSDFFSGLKVQGQDGIWEMLDYQHHTMGRGGATVKTKAKNLLTGSIVETSFRSGERFERVVFDQKPAQFLYREGTDFVFMDLESYDQLSIAPEVLGDMALYLTENLEVKIDMYEGKIMEIELPKSVELRVVQTDPGFKGDTVSGGGKPATLETGLSVNVPMFINTDEVVVVDTRTGLYLERAKR